MLIELRELSRQDGLDIFEMLKEIGPGENGFKNSGYDMNYDEFPGYLEKHINSSEGIGLEAKYVPQTIYWLIVDLKPVGMCKLRHCLNDNLRKNGGNIGYSIRPSERRKGYGKIMLKEVLNKAREMKIDKVLLTCNEDNIASRKVIESNDGVLSEVSDGKCKYWIIL